MKYSCCGWFSWFFWVQAIFYFALQCERERESQVTRCFFWLPTMKDALLTIEGQWFTWQKERKSSCAILWKLKVNIPQSNKEHNGERKKVLAVSILIITSTFLRFALLVTAAAAAAAGPPPPQHFFFRFFLPDLLLLFLPLFRIYFVSSAFF